MSADPIVYCLEKLTDYDQFERLCHDAMVEAGYRNLEPLGGAQDKGRDALHCAESEGGLATVLAYSVREDWKAKLRSDCEKVRKHGHSCDRVAFVCTAGFSSTERDAAIADIKKDFGWHLDLYGMERLRLLVRPSIIARHPQIFTSPFFPAAGGLPLVDHRDCIVIDNAVQDNDLAMWIAKKLKVGGYRIWARSLSPVGSESEDETIEKLLDHRALCLLSLLSEHSSNTAYNTRRTLATRLIGSGRLLLAVADLRYDDSGFDAKVRTAPQLPFQENWATGLERLLRELRAFNCPMTDDVPVRLDTLFREPLTAEEPETLYSNVFVVEHHPRSVLRFSTSVNLEDSTLADAQARWAFRRVGVRSAVAFHWPPSDLGDAIGARKTGQATLDGVRTVEGIAADDLMRELIRKAVEVELLRHGWRRCPRLGLAYHPNGRTQNDRVSFEHPAARRQSIALAGRRKYYRPNDRSSYYLWQICADLLVRQDERRKLLLVVRPKVRISDEDDQALEGQTVNSYRKRLCAGWWNDAWLNRVLAIAASLAPGQRAAQIGPPENSVTILTTPLSFSVSPRIKEEEARARRAVARSEMEGDGDDD